MGGVEQSRIVLDRRESSEGATIGELRIDGRLACYVLEDEYREEKVMNETRIPAGVYELTLVTSPKFTPRYGHMMIMLKDVPGFSYIYIHPGAKESHTSGCLLTGDVVYFNPFGNSVLGESRNAYDRVYKQITQMMEAETVFIQVIDEPWRRLAA